MGITTHCCPRFSQPDSNESLQVPLQPISQEKNKIGFQDFQIDGKIGQGGFGAVFLCQLKQNIQKDIYEQYAMKMVSKKKLRQKNLIQSAFDQRLIAMYLHDFIVSLIMCFQDRHYIYLVLQYASGGDTYSLIKKNTPKFQNFRKLGQNGVRFVAACVLLGLQFLHKNNYIYCDLKPQNVLLFDDGYVKLSDFGLAKKHVEGQSYKGIIGTALYYSPQMVAKKGYDKKIDLWAYGVFLYQMSNYNPPFSMQEIKSPNMGFYDICISAEKQRVWCNNSISVELMDLINKLLKVDPNSRIGANGWEQIKSHKFFANFNWKQLQQMKMVSPLKNLVKMYPIKIKQLSQQLKSDDREASKIQGWSYYGKYAQAKKN